MRWVVAESGDPDSGISLAALQKPWGGVEPGIMARNASAEAGAHRMAGLPKAGLMHPGQVFGAAQRQPSRASRPIELANDLHQRKHDQITAIGGQLVGGPSNDRIAR